MDTSIPLTSAFALLQPQQTQPDDDEAVGGAEQIQAATSQSAAPSVGALLQDFFRSRTHLEGLGLRTPRNAGDTEVLLAEVSLILGRLSANNDGMKGSADAVRKRSILNEADRNFRNLAGLDGAIQDKTLQKDQKNTERNELAAEVNGNTARIGELMAQLPTLGEEDQQQVLAEIGRLNTANNTLNAAIRDLDQQIGQLTAEIDTLTASFTILTIFGNFLGNFILRFLFQSDAVQIEETKQEVEKLREEEELSEITPAFQNLLEIDLEDAAIQEFIADRNLDETEVAETFKQAIGLLGSFFEALGVLLQAADLVELDLDASARANNKAQRLQLSL